eukprot:gene11727-5205_t
MLVVGASSPAPSRLHLSRSTPRSGCLVLGRLDKSPPYLAAGRCS